MDLDQSDFDYWLKNPITKEVYSIFQDNKECIQESLININYKDPNLDRQISFFKGALDVCNRFLDLQFEQLFIKEEEKSENEKTEDTW